MESDQYWFHFLIKSCHLFCTIPNYLGKFTCIKKSIGYLHGWKRIRLSAQIFFTRRKQRILPAVLRSGCLRFSTLGRKPRTRDLQQSLQRLWVRSPCSCLTCTLSVSVSVSLSLTHTHTHTHTHSHNGVHIICKYNLLYNRTISWWVLETGKNSYPRIPGKAMLYYNLVCTMSVVRA